MRKLVGLTLLFCLMVSSAHAAVPVWQVDSEAGEAYVVQAGDWLSTIAEKNYGDPLAYPLILEATNAKSETDESYATIDNADLIEIGQKLWIPAPDGAMPEDEAMSEATSFIVIGDIPYSDDENVVLKNELIPAVQAMNASVVVHYGDLKGGGSDCTDELLNARQAQIASMNPNRIVFTPGDNDWTDCDRESIAVRFDELERLEYVRSLFYEGTGLEMSSGIEGLVRQEGLPENAMWQQSNLMMGTLHIVGTNNGRQEILLSDETLALDTVDARDAANLAWLDELFAAAEATEGLVLVFQADIYRPGDRLEPCSAENRVECDGFAQIRDAIDTKATAYGKPVLVIHGDTNAYCFNQTAPDIANLWHLNGPGDFKVLDAAQVTFTAGADEPFQVAGILDPSTPMIDCDYSRN